MKKKLLAVLVAATMSFALVACNNGNQESTQESSAEVSQSAETTESSSEESTEVQSTEESSVEESTEKAGNQDAQAVMTYAEYVAAEVDEPVVIEAYVQANQS